MGALKFKEFNETEQNTWRELFENQSTSRKVQVIDLFSEGIDYLAMGSNRVPDLGRINHLLDKKTGFTGVPVSGLEGPQHFFSLLANRQFPIGNFIRDPGDLSYTPAPDIFHDLYGHIPFLADPHYADYCQRFGQSACLYLNDPSRLRQFERFFWFTLEFGLVHTPKGMRILGAGIASSIGECHYALSGGPEILPFDLDQIRFQEFRIDQMQTRLFVLKSLTELYESLDDFTRKVKKGT